MAFLLMQLDSDDQTPIGVYPTVTAARAAALSNDLVGVYENTPTGQVEITSITDLFDQSWDATVGNPASDLDNVTDLDIEWESGAMSVDYRVVAVIVFA